MINIKKVAFSDNLKSGEGCLAQRELGSLILITNHEKPSVAELRKFFKAKGFSELWIPKNVIYMKNPPVLGTGKFDYQSAKNY